MGSNVAKCGQTGAIVVKLGQTGPNTLVTLLAPTKNPWLATLSLLGLNFKVVFLSEYMLTNYKASHQKCPCSILTISSQILML